MTLKNHGPGGCCCDSSTTCFLFDEDFSNRSGPDDIRLPSYFNVGNYEVNVGGEYLQPTNPSYASVILDYRQGGGSDKGTYNARRACGYNTRSFSYTFWLSATDENSMFAFVPEAADVPYGRGQFRTSVITISNAGINYWGRALSTLYNPWGGWSGPYYVPAWYDTAACWQTWQDLKDLEPDNERYAETARYLSPEPQTHPFQWVPNSQTKVEFRFGKVQYVTSLDQREFDYITQRGKGDFVEKTSDFTLGYVQHGTVQLYVNDRFVLSYAGAGRQGYFDQWNTSGYDFDGGPDWEFVKFLPKPDGHFWETFIEESPSPPDDYRVFVRPSSKPEPTPCNIHRITQTVSVLAEEPPPQPEPLHSQDNTTFGKIHLCSDFSRDNSGCSYNKAGSTPLFRGLHRPSRVRVTNTEDFYFRFSDSYGATTSKIWLPGGYIYELYPDGFGETYRRTLEEDEYIQLQVSGPPQIATYWLTGYSLVPFQAPSSYPNWNGAFVLQNNMIVYLSWASKRFNPDVGEEEYDFYYPGWGMLSHTADLLDKSVSTIDFTTHYFDSQEAGTIGLSINKTGGNCKALIDY